MNWIKKAWGAKRTFLLLKYIIFHVTNLRIKSIIKSHVVWMNMVHKPAIEFTY